MLQSIRDRAKGWFAWVIVILIAIPFALWGIQEYFGPDPDVAVAEVNGTELSLRQLQQAYQQQRIQLQNLLGQGFDPSLFDEAQLRRQSLERLIRDELLMQASLDDGLRVGDEQLAQAIHDQEAFQRDGGFSQPLYEQWLRSRGYTPGGFELDFRRSLLTEQLLLGVAQSAIVSDRDSSEFIKLMEQAREYSQLVIPSERYQDVSVADEAVEEYYNNNRTRFVTPEQIRIQYIELSRDAIAEKVTVDEGVLMSYYEAEKANYVVPEQRRASHILLAVPEDADEIALDAVRKRVGELKAALDDGASFENLAKEHSEDPGSASRGGDLGFFGRGVMDSRFEEVVYSMNVGDVSAPVETKFGFHLIKLTEIQAGKTKSFEEARDDVLREYRQQEAEQLYFEQAEQLANLAFEQPDSLDPASEALGLPVTETGFFTRMGTDMAGSGQGGIEQNRKILDAAFSPEVLQEGNNSEAIELEGKRVIVLRMKEHRSSAQRGLDEVRDAIVKQLQSDAAQQKARTVGQEIVSRLNSGGDREALAQEHNLTWSAVEMLQRNADTADREVLDALFKMPRPPEEGFSYDGLLASSGNYVVIALGSVKDGEPAKPETKDRESVKQTLRANYGRADYDALVQTLRSQADVVIHEDRL